MERSKAGNKENRCPSGQSLPNKNNEPNMVVLYKIWRKVQWNSINKNANGLKQSKNEKIIHLPPQDGAC